jgi:hypothetical protein
MLISKAILRVRPNWISLNSVAKISLLTISNLTKVEKKLAVWLSFHADVSAS